MQVMRWNVRMVSMCHHRYPFFDVLGQVLLPLLKYIEPAVVEVMPTLWAVVVVEERKWVAVVKGELGGDP